MPLYLYIKLKKKKKKLNHTLSLSKKIQTFVCLHPLKIQTMQGLQGAAGSTPSNSTTTNFSSGATTT
jgi:hypothetical protein